MSQVPVKIHSPRLRVYRVVDNPEWWDFENWHWAVKHYEDSGYRRDCVLSRWGRATRFEDALSGGLAALANEYRELGLS